jgi:hypothetical protein
MSEPCPHETETEAETWRGLGRRARRELASAIRADLLAHVGGPPSVVQRELIERAVQLKVRMVEMDRAYARSGRPPDPTDRTYLDWCAGYARIIRQLGVRPPPERAPPTLAELIAALLPSAPIPRATTRPAPPAGAGVPSAAGNPPSPPLTGGVAGDLGPAR